MKPIEILIWKIFIGIIFCLIVWIACRLVRQGFDDIHSMAQDIHELRRVLCPEEPVKTAVDPRQHKELEQEVTRL